MDEKVIYNYQTGRPSEIVSNVLRSISAYTRVDRVSYFKIGITCNPENRFRQAYAGTYDKMLVIYQSSSVKNVRNLEYLLIEHNRELCDNIIAGGGGNYGEPPYYMYVVIRE
jgi:protein involved in ribonucleotide reduction